MVIEARRFEEIETAGFFALYNLEEKTFHSRKLKPIFCLFLTLLFSIIVSVKRSMF